MSPPARRARLALRRHPARRPAIALPLPRSGMPSPLKWFSSTAPIAPLPSVDRHTSPQHPANSEVLAAPDIPPAMPI